MAVRARQSFTAAVKGRRRRISRGDVLASNDPVVKGRESLFDPIDDGIETARRAPGQKRTTKKSTTKKSTKKTTGKKGTTKGDG